MSARQDRSTRGPSAEGVALQACLVSVLADLEFPARRWQILTVADLYGVDTVTRSLLERLPEHRYRTMTEVAGVLGAVLTGRPLTTAVPAPPRPVAPAVA